MRCTQEKCPIKDTIGNVKRCTVHNCQYRTREPAGPERAGQISEYPGFVEGSARVKKIKRFLQDNEGDIRLETGGETIVIDPDE